MKKPLATYALALILALGTALCAPAFAMTSVASKYVNNAELVGESRLHVFLFKVFDARLYATNGEFDATAPFALSLSYLRDIDGSSIVDKTIEEMQRQRDWDAASINGWRQALAEIIPNVNSSTTITGVRTEDAHTHIYRGEELIGRIEDPSFTAAFFDIWLGPSTSEPQLRRELLRI